MPNNLVWKCPKCGTTGPTNPARVGTPDKEGDTQKMRCPKCRENTKHVIIKESHVKSFTQFVAEAEVSKVHKEPTEVDRMKNQQKSELVLTKQRQSNELLQAKRRELDKKSREDMAKISNGTKASKH